MSKVDLGSQLDLAVAASSGDEAEGLVADACVGVVPLRRVDSAESLAAKFQFPTLGHAELLEHRRVHVPEARSADDIAAKIAHLKSGRRREAVRRYCRAAL